MANGYKKLTYYVVHNQDPMIGVLHTIKKSGKVKDSEIRKSSGENIATSTMGNWWKGKTKRPQLATIATCALSLGLQSIPLTAEGRKKVLDKYKGS